MHPPDDNRRHWIELTTGRSVARRSVVFTAVGAAWLLVGGVVAGWALKGEGGSSVVRIAIFGGILLSGLIVLGLGLHAIFVRWNFSDARVFLDRRELVIGQSFHLRVDQPIRTGVHIQEMRVALACTELVKSTGGVATKHVPLMEKWQTLTRDRDTDDRSSLVATRRFEVPPEAKPSSPATQATPPIIRWCIRLLTVPAHGATYHADFPVLVRTHQAPSWGQTPLKLHAPRSV